jgi:hypothetical protein
MGPVGRLRWLAVAGLAWIGIALGHLATCIVMHHEHDPVSRLMHSWVPLGVVLAIAAVPGVVAVAALHALHAERSFRLLSTARALAAIQLPLFLGLEALERMVAPGPFTLEPAILLGILIQIVAVVVGALVLAAVVHVVRALNGARRERSDAMADPRLPEVNRRPEHLLLLISTRRRAPPLALAG